MDSTVNRGTNSQVTSERVDNNRLAAFIAQRVTIKFASAGSQDWWRQFIPFFYCSDSTQ